MTTYDEGGILPSGLTVAVNNTGEPELVLTPADHRCPQPGCGGNVVVARIMRWCQRCRWTGYA